MSEIELIRCTKCNSIIKNGNDFCTNCGKKVENNANGDQKKEIKSRINHIVIFIIVLIVVICLGIFVLGVKNTDSSKEENFLKQIEKKYSDETDRICTDGYVYWIVDNLGEKMFFYDLASFENALNQVKSEKTLYDSISNSFIYSDRYLNKMYTREDKNVTLNVVDTDTMTFKISLKGLYDYFSSYVFNGRVKKVANDANLSSSELIEQYFPLTQINEATWRIEDKVDDLYIMTIEVEDDRIKKIDLQINKAESEAEIVKELGAGVRTIVSDSSGYAFWTLGEILEDYNYDVSIPIGVKNIIIDKQIENNETHIIVQTGFQDDYIERLKSKEINI